MPADWSQKRNRSYFVWEFGKVPDVAIEVVSNKVGNELGRKKNDYARIGVAYYAVFDPLQQLQEPEQMNGALLASVWTDSRQVCGTGTTLVRDSRAGVNALGGRV